MHESMSDDTSVATQLCEIIERFHLLFLLFVYSENCICICLCRNKPRLRWDPLSPFVYQ